MPVAVQKRVMFAPEPLDCSPRPDMNSVMFQTVVPRRKVDRFGRDTTSRSDFMFSATLFPTGVRAPALEELQRRCDLESPRNSPRAATKGMLPSDGLPDGGPRVMSLRKRTENTPDSTRSPRESNRVSVSSIQSYKWAPLESPRDIRDPMYMNTYCSGERPLRYKESTLPRINKNRPWSVGESNPSKRFVRGDSERKIAERMGGRLEGRPIHRPREAFRAHVGQSDTEHYFEVKRVSADQRTKLRGQDGCLYSQVRQCIRLIKNHERDRKIERPMKSEVGRYRPFSTTRIRTPCISPTPPIFMYKAQGSADTYRQYVMTRTLQDQVGVPKSAGTVISGAAARNNTVASTYYDTESQFVQYVADSNLPDLDTKLDCGASEDSESSEERRRRQYDLAVGLDIRSATIVPPKQTKSRTADSDVDAHFFVTSPRKWTGGSASKEISPKKEISFAKRYEKSKHSDKSGSDEGVHTNLESSPTPEPVQIQLDENGNPTIWQATPEEEHDPQFIKIPAAMAALSIDDTDTDTHDEGFTEVTSEL